MSLANVISLLVFTFGAVSFASLYVLYLGDRKGRPIMTANGFMLLFSAAWFVLNLAITIKDISYGRPYLPLYTVMLGIVLVNPPLIMHLVYSELRGGLPRSGTAWTLIRITYVVGLSLGTAAVLVGFGWMGIRFIGPVMAALAFSLPLLFLFSMAFCARLKMSCSRKEERVEQRKSRRWMLALMSLLGAVIVLLWFDVIALMPWAFGSIIYKAAPLYFFFVDTYYRSRYTFFDVFVKRGLFFFLSLAVVLTYFSIVPAWLGNSAPASITAWVAALTILPAVLAAPWAYRKLGVWLDGKWLGRQFTPVQAGKHFLNGIQHATSEQQLVRLAEEKLREIFQGPAEICLDDTTPQKSFEEAVETPIVLDGEDRGRIRMGRRPNLIPYLSEDRALVASLAGPLAFMLENIRMQAKERELTLAASRSELKALRAQINPHFLFNALNAIAGLIYQNPRRAEETVEQLSEVFRYTLARSKQEWARLDDEIEYVRSYLDVEKARFGSRLETHVETDPDLADMKVPAMMIQTLVENAVKHGVASVRGTGIVEVDAMRRDQRIRIEVRDNGPGFEANGGVPGPAAKATASGYGLQNIRERLNGYFDSNAKLKIGRDDKRNLTLVAIEMPLTGSLRQAFQSR